MKLTVKFKLILLGVLGVILLLWWLSSSSPSPQPGQDSQGIRIGVHIHKGADRYA